MADDPCKPENKYPPKPCPCPEIPGPPGPQGPVGPQGPPGTPGAPGPGVDSVFGQAFRAGSVLIFPSSAVPWDGVQNSSGVTLNTPTGIRPSQDGIYQITWRLTIFSQSTPN